MGRRNEIILEICVMVAREAELREAVSERTKVAGLVGGDLKKYSGALPINSSPRPIAEIIGNDLTEQEKRILIDSVSQFFNGLEFTSAVDGLAKVSETLDLRFQVRQAIISFLKRCMNVHVWSTKSMS